MGGKGVWKKVKGKEKPFFNDTEVNE